MQAWLSVSKLIFKPAKDELIYLHGDGEYSKPSTRSICRFRSCTRSHNCDKIGIIIFFHNSFK